MNAITNLDAEPGADALHIDAAGELPLVVELIREISSNREGKGWNLLIMAHDLFLSSLALRCIGILRRT